MNTQTEPLCVDRHDGATLCPMCRKEVLWETNFCPECGAPVDAAGVMEAPPQGKRKGFDAFYLWLAVFMAVSSISSAYLALDDPPQRLNKAAMSFYFAVASIILARRWLAARRESAVTE
jgi:hypothetical protein